MQTSDGYKSTLLIKCVLDDLFIMIFYFAVKDTQWIRGFRFFYYVLKQKKEIIRRAPCWWWNHECIFEFWQIHSSHYESVLLAIVTYLFYLEAVGSQMNKVVPSQKLIQAQYRPALSIHKSTWCSVSAAASYTPIKVYLIGVGCGIWQQCVHSDVTQGWIPGCSDRRRQLCLLQLKTIET